MEGVGPFVYFFIFSFLLNNLGISCLRILQEEGHVSRSYLRGLLHFVGFIIFVWLCSPVRWVDAKFMENWGEWLVKGLQVLINSR